LENSAHGPWWLFRNVFLRISSSFLIGSLTSDISVHLYVLGPRPLLNNLFSYFYNCFKKAGLISRSCLLEFKNSRVFNMLHLYLLMMKAAMTKHALF